MATVSRLAAFWKAFFAVLLGGTLATAATRGENEAWQSALAQNTPEAFFRYLSLYPAGDYVDQAISALARLGAIGPPRGIVPPQGPPGGQGSPAQGKPPQTGGGPYG